MSFSGFHTACAVCGNEVWLGRHRLSDKKWICSACHKKCQYGADTVITGISEEEAKKAVSFAEEQEAKAASFSPNRKIGTLMELSEEDRKWLIYTGVYGRRSNPVVFGYEDLMGFVLLEDRIAIAGGGIGQSAVSRQSEDGKEIKDGGICTSLKLQIRVNDKNRPAVYISFISAPSIKGTRVCKKIYQDAKECCEALQMICSGREKEPGSDSKSQETVVSVAEELWKLKKLMDSGVLTKEEFEAKKKQLLGL